MADPKNLPVHAQKPIALGGAVVAAMTNLTADAPGGLTLLGTVDTGGLLTRFWAVPRSNANAGNLHLYRKPAGAAHYQIIDSIAIPTYSATGTTQRPYYEFTRYSNKNPLESVPGDQFYAGSETAQPTGIDVNITGRGF